MSERTTRTPTHFPENVADPATIAAVRLQLHESADLVRFEPLIAASETEFSEPTRIYPVGLREDLCGLSSCRRRTRTSS